MLGILLIVFLYFTSCDDSSSDKGTITEDATVIYYRCYSNIQTEVEAVEKGLDCINFYNAED